MFNTRDPLFGKKDDHAQKDFRTNAAPLPRSAAPSATPPSLSTAPALTEQPMPSALPAPEFTKGSKLIVGPDIKLKGVEITDCDTLVVEGRVEASMDSRVIQIAEHGIYSGTVGIDVAEIHGRFEGELTARKQLVIHATGRVSGKIRYGKITVEEGGELSGDIHTLTSAGTPDKGATHAYDATQGKSKAAAMPH